MKLVIISALAIGTATLLTSCATRDDAQTADGPAYGANAPAGEGLAAPLAGAADNGWPMTFNDGTTIYTIFEPQCDSWDGHELGARSAVAVQPPGQAQPTYGVISFDAITLVDKATHTVTLADFKLISADFPSARNQAQNYLVPILIKYSKPTPPLALARLEGSLAMPEPPKAERLDNAPPKIITTTRPAVLVYVDGPPVWRPVPGTTLERVINARMLVLKDASGLYYTHLFDGYLEAPSLDGPWKVASQPPAGAEAAEKQAADSGQVDLMRGTPDDATHNTPSLHSSPVPDLFVTTTPSELIQFGGLAEFAAIPGTDLLYAVNTSGNVFKLLTDQQTYILISGRWYRASSLNGPWQFVPGNELPRDFANIPDTSPKENVKASVPGTPQAEEALIANSIPQSTAIARNSQMPDPQIDGAMQIAPIEGTPLHYVVNSATPIIEVNPQSWYACQNGVWFAASSATGPWAVATAVPPDIYTIPPTSPLHYLTYVQVYGSTPDEVYDGYTPGYMGTEVGDDGTVVYGTGYDYAPWIGSEWYGPPVTWGCGFDNCWNPWWGWGFDSGFGWGWGFGAFGGYGCYPPHPWWGGYGGWHGHDGGWWRDGGHRDMANTGADFYHHDGRPGANGFNGTARQNGWNGYGHAYNSRTGQLAGGQRGQVLSVSGSAWNPARESGWSQNNGFGSYNRDGRFNVNNWSDLSRPVNPTGSREWFGSRQQGYGTGQYRPSFSPRYGGMNRPFQGYQYGGWHGGNSFNTAPHGGGWVHSVGNFFHGGGGGGGGFRGGGGGGFHGGGGGGGGGRGR